MSNNNSSNNNNRGGKNGKNGGFRGVLTLIAWALVLTVAFQYFNAYNNNAANKSTSHEIKYSDMISMIEKDQVKEILFKDSTIYVTPCGRLRLHRGGHLRQQDGDKNLHPVQGLRPDAVHRVPLQRRPAPPCWRRTMWPIPASIRPR